MIMTLIYGLIDPTNDELRYVGKVVHRRNAIEKSLQDRLRGHLRPRSLNGKNYRICWLKSMKEREIYPEIFLIEEITGDQSWQEAEKFWISYFKFLGCRLVNSTAGGDGLLGYINPPESRSGPKGAANYWYGTSGPMGGKKHSPEIRKKISAGLKGKKKTPEHAAKAAAGQRGKIRSEQCKANLRAAWVRGDRKDLTKKSLRAAWAKRPRIWITDGINSKHHFASEPIPEGWRQGRVGLFGRAAARQHRLKDTIDEHVLEVIGGKRAAAAEAMGDKP